MYVCLYLPTVQTLITFILFVLKNPNKSGTIKVSLQSSSCICLILTILDEMFLKQGRNARWAAKAIGEAVGKDFRKFDTFLCIEALQELYQLHNMQTNHSI